MTNNELIGRAVSAMRHSYSPYSGFTVGAALLTSDGEVYEGANLENAAFSPTVCAERVAIFKAVFDGHRKFEAIAVVDGMGEEISSFTYPCGVCRQVMSEFCSSDMRVLLYDGTDIKETTLGALLPNSFGGEMKPV